MSGLWAIQKNADPSSSQPGTALPDKARRGIAGQISEHLRYATRRPIVTHTPAPRPIKQPLQRVSAFASSGTPSAAALAETRERAAGERDWPSPLRPGGSAAGGNPVSSLSASPRASAPSEDTPAPVRALPIVPVAENTPGAEAQQTAGALNGQAEIPPQPEGTPYLTFRLGKVRWGIPVIYLREALPDAPPITPLPFSPIWLHGLINLRGEAVGLINLSDLLLDPVIAASTARADAAIPVVVAEHEGVSLALQVQELGEVIFLEESQFRHLSGAQTRSLPAFAVSHLQAAWFSGQSQSPLLLLDLPRLMASLLEQMTAQEAMGDG
jgi:chemotaxis signal transduction protein